MNFEQTLGELHAGSITFDAFARATQDRWSALAKMLMRRWRAPPSVGLEDVIQELLLGAWQHVWKYEPQRAPAKTKSTLGRYVVWNACDRAKKKLHKARGARLSGSADRNGARFDVAFSSLHVHGDMTIEEYIDSLANEYPAQYERVERVEAAALAVACCRSRRERVVVSALAGKDSLLLAARAIYDDTDARLACRLSSEEHAERVVVRTAVEVACRLEAAAA